MQALLGFHVGFWDYVTFGAMAVIVMAFLALAVFILGLPGRIAIARNHLAPGETRFTYSVAIEPRLALSMGGPIA